MKTTRELIEMLLDLIDDEQLLLLIYRYINWLYCRH